MLLRDIRLGFKFQADSTSSLGLFWAVLTGYLPKDSTNTRVINYNIILLHTAVFITSLCWYPGHESPLAMAGDFDSFSLSHWVKDHLGWKVTIRQNIIGQRLNPLLQNPNIFQSTFYAVHIATNKNLYEKCTCYNKHDYNKNAILLSCF